MYEILKEMIRKAEKYEDYDLIEWVRQIVYELAITINCPSNWRSICDELLDEYDCSSWVYENLELWNYEE